MRVAGTMDDTEQGARERARVIDHAQRAAEKTSGCEEDCPYAAGDSRRAVWLREFRRHLVIIGRGRRS